MAASVATTNKPMSTSMFEPETYGSNYRSVAFGTWRAEEPKRFDKFKRTRTPDARRIRRETNEEKPLAVRKAHSSSPLIAADSLARLAVAEDSTIDRTISPQKMDCYSSTEYVQYCEAAVAAAAQHAYENVLLGSGFAPLNRRSVLNRSMDALNERIIHYNRTSEEDPIDQPNGFESWAFRSEHGVLSSYPSTSESPLDRNCRIRHSTRPEPTSAREYIVDPGPVESANSLRHRAKSLDNTNRISPSDRPRKVKRASSKQPEDRSALQSAKNFLRRLYTNSTLRLRGRSGRKDVHERFQLATSPFYEVRLPDPDERPYLPYNIRYEVEDDEDEGAVFDSHLMNTPPCSSSSAVSTAQNHSPDEGMFSAGEESTVSSSRSSASSANAVMQRPSPTVAPSFPYQQRPGSGLSASTNASTGNSAFSSAFGGESSATSTPRKIPLESFRNWSELFEHLKKEITDMRARDAQILHNLKTIEEEINMVKQGTTSLN